MKTRLEGGEGAEKIVYNDPHNNDRVIKEYKFESHSIQEVKAGYYIGKLLHLLLPSNIPNTHLSGKRKDKNAIMVQEKIERDSEHVRLNHLFYKKEKTDSERTEELNLSEKRKVAVNDSYLLSSLKSLGVGFDQLPRNFSLQDNDEVVYLDSFQPWLIKHPLNAEGHQDLSRKKELILNFNEQKVRTHIAGMQDEYHRHLAEVCLQRLHGLAEEEAKEWGILVKKDTT